jgi:hypothetical protein
MTNAERIAAATRASDEARERFVESIQALAQQLEPKRLARELWEDAKDKGADLAEEAVDAVKARPLAVGGVAAAIALFLAREPIADFAGKMLKGNGAKPAPKKKAAPRKSADRSAPTQPMETKS